MALLIPISNCKISDVNAFYKCNWNSLPHTGGFSAVSIGNEVLNPVTFTEAGNVKGVFIEIGNHGYTYKNDWNILLRIKLQENVSGTWTDRLSNEIYVNTLITDYHGNRNGFYRIKFDLGGTYAVDTTASKWRITISPRTGSTGNFYMPNTTNATTNYCFAVYTDTVVSFADGDALCIGENVEIDQTCTIGYNTATGGSNVAVAFGAGKKLFVDNATLTAPITATFRGYLYRCKYDEFLVGTEASPISIANKCTILMDTPTTPTGFIDNRGSTSRNNGGSNTLFYGETRAYTRTTLTADANAGTNTLTVADAVDWQAGDKIQITHADRNGSCESITGVSSVPTVNGLYVISSVVGNTITLTTNLYYKRLTGGKVCMFSGTGVEFRAGALSSSSSNYLANNQFVGAFNQFYKGVECINLYYLFSSSGDGTYFGWIAESYDSDMKVGYENSSARVTQASYYYDGVYITGLKTNRFINNNFYYIAPCYTMGAVINANFKSSPHYFDDNILIYNQVYTLYSGTQLPTIYARRNLWCNSTSSSTYINGLNSVYEDNQIYGVSTSLTFTVGYCIGYRGKNNQFLRGVISNALFYFVNSFKTDNIEEDFYVNSALSTIPYGFDVDAGTVMDFTFKNANFVINPVTTKLVDLPAGSKVRVINDNQVTNADKVVFPNGYLVRTGYEVSDTTVWNGTSFDVATAGQFGIRFEILSGTLSYEQSKTTGNIQNKTMFVSARVKINNPAYYAGTHTLPTLRVVYDDGVSSVSSVATATTNAQQLVVYFTPTTTSGSIKIYLEMMSDATGSNSYVYLGELIAPLPEGNAIDTTRFGLWSNAMPLDTISTIPIPGSVLNEKLSNYTISGSVGKKIKDGFTVADSQALL